MDDEKELTEGERILKVIRDAEERNIVVFWTLDQLSGMDLDAMISQPTDGLLYDLNRDKATCATWIEKDGATGTWVNNYASALVIERLKEKLKQAEDKIQTLEDAIGAENV
jgi:hypothetical protein